MQPYLGCTSYIDIHNPVVLGEGKLLKNVHVFTTLNGLPELSTTLFTLIIFLKVGKHFVVAEDIYIGSGFKPKSDIFP